jgi:hypothetical protein
MHAMHESTYQKDVKKIAPLDASYHTMRDSSDGEKLQTHHRTSAMHESTYHEDVKNETYQENRSCHQVRDDEGSTSPKKSPNPHHMSGTDDYDQYNVGSKPKTKEQEGHTKIEMIPLAIEGEEGHN